MLLSFIHQYYMIFPILALSALALANSAVGVVMTPASGTLLHKVPSSLVKIVEMNGFQAVPIFLSRPIGETLSLLKKLNAIVFSFEKQNFDKYQQQSLQRIILQVEIMQKSGISLPLLCLGNGFAKLLNVVAPQTSFVSVDLDSVKTINITLKDSYLFNKVDKQIIGAAQTRGLFYFNSELGILDQIFQRSQILNHQFRKVALSKDKIGRDIVVALEGKNSPLFLVLFSPQANLFQYRLGTRGADHSYQGVLASQQVLNSFFQVVRSESSRMSEQEINERSFLNNQVSPGEDIYSWYIL